jgi:hypothetical protein
VVSDTTKEPQKIKNGKGAGGRKAAEAGPEAGAAEPDSTR